MIAGPLLAEGMDERPQRTSHDEEDRDRTSSNVVLLVFFVVIVGIGIWLANALFDARRADECIAQGRRNCNPIDVQSR